MKKIRNILVITSIYPADDLSKENTPVVHFFTRQWVQNGCNVVVIHCPYNFPKIILGLARPFISQLKRFFGMAVVRTSYLQEIEYQIEGVRVKRFPLTKLKPHGRYSRKEIESVFKKTVRYLESLGFVPDVITAHWANPQLELLPLFKNLYGVPICYVDHLAGRDIVNVYKKESFNLINSIDLIGYRSRYIKRTFELLFNPTCPSFYCYSGIPEEYLPANTYKKQFGNITNFIFVGTLIKRKFPAEIIPALCEVYDDNSFRLRYVGRGEEEKNIISMAKQYNVTDNVELCGRVTRDEVVKKLDSSEVLVMMSKSETFGLVYLEAMARGCITVASWREGFDGIIENGVNGFLCEPGDSKDLARIINKIRQMPNSDLMRISENAMLTARKLTDKRVAEDYLHNLSSLLC